MLAVLNAQAPEACLFIDTPLFHTKKIQRVKHCYRILLVSNCLYIYNNCR